MKGEMAAVILGAGYGQIQSGTSKLLHPFLGKALVAHGIQNLHSAGFKRPILVLNPTFGDQVMQSLIVAGYEGIQFVVQETPNGPAGALQRCLPKLLECGARNAIVIFGDMPFQDPCHLRAIAALHREEMAVLTVSTWEYEPTHALASQMINYAHVCDHSESGQNNGFPVVMQYTGSVPPKGSHVLSSVYVVNSEWFADAVKLIKPHTKPGGLTAELHMTKLIEVAAFQSRKVARLELVDPLQLMGINTQNDLDFLSAFHKRRGWS